MRITQNLSGGELALLLPKYQPQLSMESKLEIVREVDQKQLSLSEVALKHLIPRYSLERWMKAYHQFGESGLARKGTSNGMKKNENYPKLVQAMHMLDDGHSVNYIQKRLRVDRKTLLLARRCY